MINRNAFRFPTAISIWGILSLANSLAAAEATSGTSTPQQLEEIVVTATKHSEQASKVPISLEAFSQKQLKQSGAKGIDEIAALTPGIEFDSSPFGPNTLTNIAIRGVSSIFGAPTTGVYLDDVPLLTRVTLSSGYGDLYPVTFDLQRVEVLRGPQGTLFGAGAEGGAIRFIPVAPSLTAFSGAMTTEFGGTDGGDTSYEAGAALGGPIVEGKLGFRVAAWYRRDGGYVDHVDPISGQTVEPNSNWADTTLIRSSALLQPADWLTIEPQFNYQLKDNHDTGVLFPYLSDISNGVFKNGTIERTPAADHSYLSSLKIEANLDFATLDSISSYLYRNTVAINDATAAFGAEAIFTNGEPGYGNPLGPAYPSSDADAGIDLATLKERVYTQELRLSSRDPASPFKWVTGIFLFHSTQVETADVTSQSVSLQDDVPAGEPIVFGSPREDDTQIAAFGQVDYDITNSIKATVGLRVARTRYDSVSITNGFFYGGQLTASSGGAKETPVTPKFALSYTPNPNDYFYFSAGKGYRVGGVNAAFPSYCGVSPPQTYNSDSVWTYEVGSKNNFFDRKLLVDVSGYHTDWNNIQTLVTYGCGLSGVLNAGAASISGFDIAAQALITPRFKMGLSLAYTDARYTKDLVIQGELFIKSGDTVGQLPQVTSPLNVTANAEYNFPINDKTAGYLRAEDIFHGRNPGPFTSEIASNPFIYDPGVKANPAYSILNLRAGVTLDDGLDISLFLNNALNSHPTLNVFDSGPNLKFYYDSTIRPLTVGINTSYKF